MIRLLVPTGIGDVYWVMTKLESFCKKHNITEKPAVTILTDSDNPGYFRTVPFLEMIPFIQVGELAATQLDPIKPRPEYIQKIYEELYTRNGRTIYPGLYGYDYFMSYNGIINSGNWIESCADGLDCNWYFDLFVSEEQKQFCDECKDKYGKYIVFYWTFNGNYIDYQLKQFSFERIILATQQIVSRIKLVPVFIGAYWDLQYNDLLMQLMSKIPNAVNLVGQTSLDQAFGVIHGSEFVMGYHSGITNMAVAFKKKTVLLWPSSLPNAHQWPSSIPLAVAPPETRNTTYKPVFTGDLTVENLVEKATNLYEEVN